MECQLSEQIEGTGRYVFPNTLGLHHPLPLVFPYPLFYSTSLPLLSRYPRYPFAPGLTTPLF
jgi:hypothetical protein